jgi:PAS domain S-box-containing protein
MRVEPLNSPPNPLIFMKQTNLTNLLLDQSKDLVWMINLDFQLIYANKAYLSLMRKITGVEKKLNESVLVEGFGAGDIEQWKTYYNRALKGEFFEIEEHYNHPESNEIQYSQVTFEPLTGDDHKIFAIACQSRDGTALVKQRSEANQLIIANKELDFQNQENKNRADELITANQELDFQTEEKRNRGDELIIANKELVIQNEEKKNRVDELDVANKELDFQNEEKKNRADELIIANDKTDIENNSGNQLAIAIKALSDYKYALDQSSIIAITDQKGIINYVNENFCKISKYSADELIGQDHRIISSGYHSKIFIKNLWTTISHGKIWRGELKNRAKDGTIYWVDTTIVPFLNEKGKPIQYLSIRTDITKKKEEEHRLKLFESVITNTKDAVLITEAEPFDHPGPRILYVNEAFTKMTGYTSDEVIGKTPRILQGPNSNREELARLSRAIRNWESCEITTINYKKNREEFWINFKLTPVADEKGCYTHWISIERDVTEQKIKELEINLINEISNIFQQINDNDLTGCLTNVCEHIAKFGNFEFTEIWLPTNDGQTINRVTNYVSGTVGNAFYEASENLKSLVLGEGMPGFVWKNKKTEIWEDVDVEWGFFKRKIAAKKAGVGAIMGVPLKDNGEVIGVLLVGTEKTKSAFALYSRLFQKLESSIGSELSRKKIEIELAQIFDFTPGILCVAGFDGYLKRINPAGLEILGYSLEEMKSKPISSFVHKEDRLATKEQQINLYNGGGQTNFENRYITKQGKIVWLSWTAISIPEHGILYAVAKDITEEKNLRELNRQANHLAKIGSWEVDLVKQSVFWSDEVHQLHETDPKSFVPSLEASINFYRADFRKIVQLNVEECISTGESFEFEAVLVTAKKKELWVRIIGTTEFADGVCKRIYGSLQDINDRKESENRLRSLSENVPGVIYKYIIHPDGTDAMMHISGGVEELWGYTADEIMANVNLIWEQIRLGGDFEEVNASILKSIQTKSRWTCRFKTVIATGELKTHLGNGTPVFLADGSIVFDVIILDITPEAKNEELLEQTTKMARIGSWEMDLINQDGDCMYWSPMVREILEVDDSYNPTLNGGIEFYIGESKERIKQAVTALINEGLEFDEELLLLTVKGNERWIRAIGKSEMANNNRNKIYGSFQDIDERKKSAIKLAESENRFRTILEAEPECIKLLGPGGELLMMNPAGLAMIEADSEEQVIGKSMQGILLPEFRSAFIDLTKNIFKGESGKLEFEIEGLKGTHRWLETHAVPMKNAQGDIISLLGVTRDFTERKKAEEKILKSNERFKKVTEATKDAIWDWDIVNQTYYRSKAIERFFGKEDTGLFPDSNMWSRNYFHEDDFANIKSSFYEAIANPLITRWELEYRVINELGDTLYVIDRAAIYRNNEGKAIRMVGAMTDISEQKQMTLQLNELNQSLQKYSLELERSNEELEQFAFVTSHDLQEPLRMISSFMDLLKRKYGDKLDEKGHQYIHFATDGAKRMKQIILDLLDYSRASKILSTKEEVDFNLVLSEFMQLRRKLISEKSASITSGNLPSLISYKASITQVFHCLLDNAIKYSLEGTSPIVEINAVENEKEWEFSIKDNGIGIDPQFYNKIFVIFQRLHNREEYAGTGIGLSIAKKQVEFLGGKIWLESEPGVGTVFYFTIPKNN